MSQHHFIIMFDSITGEWSQDVESEQLRFDQGTIWLTETDEWIANTNSNNGTKALELNKTAEQVITGTVKVLNQMYRNSQGGN